MHIETNIESAPGSIMATLAHGLEIEFGQGAGEALAHRFLEAEETDFLWDARISERWLGSYASVDEDGIEIDRIAVLGKLGRRWFAATIIVDGEGQPHGLTGRRNFSRRREAERAFAHAG